MSDISTPPDGEAIERDRTRPPDEASSYDIQPPPTEDAEIAGVPDASDALDDTADDRPGANDTGVGS
jgi:hypothetical protein